MGRANGKHALVLNNFFVRHSFKIILVVLFLLPVLSRGARKALLSNDNNVHDWLPTTYEETLDFAWFQQHFDNETFVLVSWDGCTLDDPRLELFARKLIPPADKQASAKPRSAAKPAPPQWYDDFLLVRLVQADRTKCRPTLPARCSRAWKPARG